MIEIALRNIEKYYGGKKVLEDMSFEILRGDKVGILGRNGTGKTTIFKIISRLENYDGGSLSIRKGTSIGHLDQIPEYIEVYRAIDVLRDAFKEEFIIKEGLRSLEAEMIGLQGEKLDRIMKKYGELQIEYEHRGGYEIEEKINRICTGLKIREEFKERCFNTLSGGEKTTIMLGKILLQSPSILLLDEPTNHLDVDSVQWLEEFLREYRGTVLIISHDRYFIDALVDKIVEVEGGRASIYHGNYSYYVVERERRLLEQLQAYKNQQKKINAMEEAVKRFKVWGNKGDNPAMHKKASNMEKRINRIDKIDRPTLEKSNMKLNFTSNLRSGKDVIKVRGLKKAFGDKVVLEDLNFHVRYGERVAILGKNGCGKSTLIRVLLKEMAGDDGEVKMGSGAKIGYLQQEIEFKNEEHTILEAFREYYPVSEGQARGILAGFLFYAEDVFKKVKNLSGGEKVRLKLCKLMHGDINLLILDEPTNHLDIDSRETLERTLYEFGGTIVFISHDRYFINKIAHRIVELHNKKLINYLGNYDYYREKKSRDKLDFEEKSNIKRVKKKGTSNINKIRDNNERIIKELENKIEELEAQIENLDRTSANHSHDYEKLAEIHDKRCNLQQGLEGLLEDWIKLNS